MLSAYSTAPASVDGTHFGQPWCERHGSGRVYLITGHTSSLREAVLTQTLTLLGGIRFIAWRLRRPFLGVCRRGPWHFWKCQAHLGYDPAPGPTLKSPCATLVRLVGRRINTTNTANWVEKSFLFFFIFLNIIHKVVVVCISLCANLWPPVYFIGLVWFGLVISLVADQPSWII